MPNRLVSEYEQQVNENTIDNKLHANIDFQDFFANDKATFFINNCLIFNNEYLNSDKSVGVTGVFLKIKKEKTSLIILLNDEKTIKCITKDNELNLKIMVNNVESIFTINLKKGKYIGLEKLDNNKLYLNQSLVPFEYD